MSPSSATVLCPTCQKHFSAKTDMTRHRQTHAPNKESLKTLCPFEGCSYKTLQRSNLLSHMNTHTGERPHECTECEFRSADPGSLTRHRKAVHGYEPKQRGQASARSVSRKSARHEPSASSKTSVTPGVNADSSALLSLYLLSDVSSSSPYLPSSRSSVLDFSPSRASPAAPASPSGPTAAFSDADLHIIKSWFSDLSLSTGPADGCASARSNFDDCVSLGAWFRDVSSASSPVDALSSIKAPLLPSCEAAPAHMLDASGSSLPVEEVVECELWMWDSATPATDAPHFSALSALVVSSP
ncbi:hypothetical protein PLICRDRAFT_700973 [Plicaturopsis crispa FD-325 SS-3]|nr:hypothetical protein PLICRDRAFT_700973 [Plicaturopsis crispa FD-325 SS-3]